MTPEQAKAINDRLDVAANTIQQQCDILSRVTTLGEDLEQRFARSARKLDFLAATITSNNEVIRLLTARVQKLETELKEIST